LAKWGAARRPVLQRAVSDDFPEKKATRGGHKFMGDRTKLSKGGTVGNRGRETGQGLVIQRKKSRGEKKLIARKERREFNANGVEFSNRWRWMRGRAGVDLQRC